MMSTENKRFMLSLTPELKERSEAVKQSTYYNTSYAEMFRQLISLGLKTLENKQTNTNIA